MVEQRACIPQDSLTDSYYRVNRPSLGSSRYMGADHSSYSDRGSSMLFNQSDALRFSAADIGSRSYGGGIGVSQASWPGVDIGASASAADPFGVGFKRPSESNCVSSWISPTFLSFHSVFSLYDCSFTFASAYRLLFISTSSFIFTQ